MKNLTRERNVNCMTAFRVHPGGYFTIKTQRKYSSTSAVVYYYQRANLYLTKQETMNDKGGPASFEAVGHKSGNKKVVPQCQIQSLEGH